MYACVVLLANYRIALKHHLSHTGFSISDLLHKILQAVRSKILLISINEVKRLSVGGNCSK